MLKWIMDTTKSISGTSSIISFAADYEIAFISANCGNLSGKKSRKGIMNCLHLFSIVVTVLPKSTTTALRTSVELSLWN